ncbi:ABC transporter permease [Paenibacillus solani]|uniref:Transport permease protein n=1 Tax=Paenibacillus solani TaxID=1705565 RepID=A0A0M1N1T2_9BACL|nr:ABC transporter permease [Paenibacillus solani]KOR76121.1 ABC transporter [Paenibacillus solani]
MWIVMTTMLRSMLRDIHTLVWNILFPMAMLIGLGLYFNDAAYSYRLLGGVLTTNILFGATMVTAFNVMAHRNRGIYKLLRATPFRTVSFIAAMTGARTVLALLVSACVILMSLFLLGVKLSLTGLGLMMLVLLIGTVCFTALGFLAANLSRDENNVNMISNLMSFPLLLTSEAFYSLEHAPNWIVTLGHLQPFHYLVDAMAIAMHPQSNVSSIWMPLLILAGFTILILGAAAWTFRWDAEQPVRWKQGAARKAATM